MAPAGTPKAVVDRLQDAFGKVVAGDSTYAARLPVGMFPSHVAGSEFAAFMQTERIIYGGIIKKLNLKLD